MVLWFLVLTRKMPGSNRNSKLYGGRVEVVHWQSCLLYFKYTMIPCQHAREFEFGLHCGSDFYSPNESHTELWAPCPICRAI